MKSHEYRNQPYQHAMNKTSKTIKVLTIFAHPDDETMFTGGTLALMADAGAELHFLCATRGEGGELGEPPVSTREEIGIYRERELSCAIRALGGGSLSFLNYIDPLIGDQEELYPYTEDFRGLVDQIIGHIQTIHPTAVLTHGINGEYGHPGHVLTHKAVWEAVENLGKNAPLLYIFCADFPGHPRPRHANKDHPAHLILDVTPVMERKTKAAYCHRSQHALFVRRSSQTSGYHVTIPEILLSIESLHRAYPQTNGLPRDEITRFLGPWEKAGSLQKKMRFSDLKHDAET
jgi:LmbE family N-acetylglucosaminyl deacetylase